MTDQKFEHEKFVMTASGMVLRRVCHLRLRTYKAGCTDCTRTQESCESRGVSHFHVVLEALSLAVHSVALHPPCSLLRVPQTRHERNEVD
jgi:hypothetical protein